MQSASCLKMSLNALECFFCRGCSGLSAGVVQPAAHLHSSEPRHSHPSPQGPANGTNSCTKERKREREPSLFLLSLRRAPSPSPRSPPLPSPPLPSPHVQMFFTAGIVLNEGINFILKHLIKEARPTNSTWHYTSSSLLHCVFYK